MNQLTKYLISEILDGQKVTAVFGGGFKPPTKGHFDIVKKALNDYKEIDKFIIYVGGGVRDGITQEQAIQIWQMYKELLGNKVEIIPASNPIGDVKRYAKNNPDEKVYFVIGAREGREDDIADVTQRTAGVEEKYPNTKVKLITTPDGGMSGTNARKALKSGNKEEFFTYLPEKVPASEKESIWDLLNNALVKENLTKEDQVDQLERLLDRWSAYSGQYDLLPQIAKLAKGLRVNNGPSIVYRAVPGLDEYPYTKQEIIDFDKEQEIVSTTSTKEQAEYFINNNADWAYILEYKPHIIINFDEFEEKYGWTGNWGEGELLIDVPKSKLLKITKVDIIKEASDPQAGTALPYGSGYKKVNEIGVKLSNYSGQVLAGDVVRAPKGFPLGGKKLEKSLELKVKKISREGVNRYKLSLEDSDGKNYTVRNYQMDGEYKGEKLPKWGLVRKSKENVNENTIPSIDIVQKCAELTQHMIDKGYNIRPLPLVKFISDDLSNAENFLGKTAYYNPDKKMIVVYTYGRHPKDIVRSFAHEMIHHMQNLEGRLGDITTTDTTEDDRLNDLEKEANLKGTMTFRNWTDSLQENKVQVNELAIAPLLIKGLIGIITTVGAGLIKAFGSIMVDRVIDGAILIYQDIKNIVAPEPYIKFLKGLEKNDEFNKQFIELTLSQRKPDAKVLLGSEWENAMTSLPAFVEAFDKFTAGENISGDAKTFLLARIQRSMREAYMSGWRDIHKILKKKYPDLTQDLKEAK